LTRNDRLGEERSTAMCDTNAFLVKQGVQEKILESVERVEFLDGEIRLTNIFGEQNTIRAKPTLFDNTQGVLLFEPLSE
jgi:predicted RNA-binding protein